LMSAGKRNPATANSTRPNPRRCISCRSGSCRRSKACGRTISRRILTTRKSAAGSTWSFSRDGAKGSLSVCSRTHGSTRGCSTAPSRPRSNWKSRRYAYVSRGPRQPAGQWSDVKRGATARAPVRDEQRLHFGAGQSAEALVFDLPSATSCRTGNAPVSRRSRDTALRPRRPPIRPLDDHHPGASAAAPVPASEEGCHSPAAGGSIGVRKWPRRSSVSVGQSTFRGCDMKTGICGCFALNRVRSPRQLIGAGRIRRRRTDGGTAGV